MATPSHVHNGVEYVIAVPPEEATRRVAQIVRKLWPVYLQILAEDEAAATVKVPLEKG